jgi:transcriptional regulator with XRE-family HTH domain
MHLQTNLPEIRGKRAIKEIAEASGINPATIRQVEAGTLVPREKHIGPLEAAYGAALEAWYSPRALLALQEDAA